MVRLLLWELGASVTSAVALRTSSVWASLVTTLGSGAKTLGAAGGSSPKLGDV